MVKLFQFRNVILWLTLLSLSCRLIAGQGVKATRSKFNAAVIQAAVGHRPSNTRSEGFFRATSADFRYANGIGRMGRAFLRSPENIISR
ncbi:hypothetical protein MAR_036635 [Mya arenaria]|uniref:Secreted protein n=1 Tax=Mya arenaria TaxID=6604 RepID=A0ABY7FPX4_MYAAR|nr:hypothetical protein MAR_036635 [Mya arenaria]